MLAYSDLKSKDTTAYKMKYSIKDFFSKCDEIRRKLRIWSRLLKQSLLDNFIFCVVFVLEVLQIFTKAFLLKNIIWTWIFFKYCRLATLLKNEKKNLLKKDVSQLKIAWYSKRQRKSIEKRERKTKNENKSNNNNKYFFTLTFLYRKSYIFLENIFGKT